MAHRTIPPQVPPRTIQLAAAASLPGYADRRDDGRRYFAIPSVCGAFMVLSEKMKTLERVGAKAGAARKRYVHLQRLKSGKDHKSSPVFDYPTERPVPPVDRRSQLPSLRSKHSKRLVRSVIQGIFSRLDGDASGAVDAAELVEFVIKALPQATPRAQALLGSDPSNVGPIVSRLAKNRAAHPTPKRRRDGQE